MGATLLLTLVMLSAWRLGAQPEELEDVEALDWWQRGVFYQIYPRSFQDSNGDGVGDLRGIGSRLDYLKTLGITGVWLSPIYQSPQADFGYDISDFRKIDPVYGSLADFARLRDGVHERGLKLILDLVPNHTSDEHEWFQKALQNDPHYADYYVWHKGKLLENGTRTYPNNWLSFFDGPAWTWSEQRQMYYLRQYHPKQPDLNYRNPAVLQVTSYQSNGLFILRIPSVKGLYATKAVKHIPLFPCMLKIHYLYCGVLNFPSLLYFF